MQRFVTDKNAAKLKTIIEIVVCRRVSVWGCGFVVSQTRLDGAIRGASDAKCFHRSLTGFQLQWKPLKVSKDLSGRRWALFGETISLNDLYYFVSVSSWDEKRLKYLLL